uniref:Monotonin n=1 Tax=Argas monolakensis TaxID=34602 RepID=Q09JV9_ARGMO|nr:monotonin [Argas monolakensis]
MVSVAIAVACLFAAVSTEASAPCNFNGPFQAWRSVNGPGSGGYYMVKTTDPQTPDCPYVLVPRTRLTEGDAVEFTYGSLEDGELTRRTATVSGQGSNIVVTGGDNPGTTTLIFSDYQTCDVVRGPTGGYELWVHADNVHDSSHGCCDTKFYQVTGGNGIRDVYQETCPPLPTQ